jgi:hypothetical protein
VQALICAVFSVATGTAQTTAVLTAKVRPDFDWPYIAGSEGRASQVGGSSMTDQSPIEAVPSREQVEVFLSSVSRETAGPDTIKVGQFRFVRLWQGRLTLLALTSGARELYYTMDVVDWNGRAAQVQFVHAEPPYDLATDVLDVDGDGNAEILTNTLALGYQGASTKPIAWRQVLKMQADGTLEDVSYKNRRFYETTVIPKLDAAAAALPERYVGNELVEGQAAVQIVRFKYRRLLYQEREAGLDVAENWAHSANLDLRRASVVVLADIGSTKARAILTELSYSNDAVLAGSAKAALEQPERRK